MTTPRTHAFAYRIWAYAEPLGWNCTIREVADHLGVSAKVVSTISQWRNWLDRFRVDPEKAVYLAKQNGGHRYGMAAGFMTAITPADYRARAELDE